jgi:hypothetical protein
MVRGIFCDLEKAFDSVHYDILLSKLEYYGVRGIDKAFYQSYLQNRYIYINDLPKAINNGPTPILFFDDTNILFSHSNPDDVIENIHSLF